MTKSPYSISRREIRQIASIHGLAHAEFCLEQAASQIGSEKNEAARDEFRTICKNAEQE